MNERTHPRAPGRHPRSRRLACLAGGLIGLFLAVSAAPGAAAAEQPATSPVEACTAAAEARNIDQWVCLGGTLHHETTKTVDGKRKRVLVQERIAANVPGKSTAPRRGAVATDDYDTWCENGTTCTRAITDYISETKGNAAYGDSEGAIGSFDVILRTRLNGSQPQFKGTFIWDSGPTLTFTGTGIECREDQIGPDSSCGAWPVDGPDGNGAFAIGEDDFRDDGPLIYGNRLEDASTYFAKIFGNFQPTGHDTYVMGELESGRWDCFGVGSQCLFE